MFGVFIHPERRHREGRQPHQNKKTSRFQNPDLAVSTTLNLLFSDLLYGLRVPGEGNLIVQVGWGTLRALSPRSQARAQNPLASTKRLGLLPTPTSWPFPQPVGLPCRSWDSIYPELLGAQSNLPHKQVVLPISPSLPAIQAPVDKNPDLQLDFFCCCC